MNNTNEQLAMSKEQRKTSHHGLHLTLFFVLCSSFFCFSCGFGGDIESLRPEGPEEQKTNKIEMVRINAGTFTMGSPETEPGHSDYEIQHQVTLTNDFFIGKYPVTQAQYQAVMGTNPSYHMVIYENNPDNRPVESVSWYDALVFCNKLSLQEGYSPAYSINGLTDPAAWGDVPTNSNTTWNAVTIVAGSTGYRLPTEAQWEYACRAGTTTAYNTGNTISDNTGWYNSNSYYGTYDVGLKSPNAWGLYDMHGNVEEWCWDWFGAYASEAQTDPMGVSSGFTRVIRGGDCNKNSQSMRSASRNHDYPNSGTEVTGFRLSRPTVFTVTFNANGATSGTAPAARTVNAGSTITLPGGSGFAKNGYTFGGWNTTADGKGTNYSADFSYTVNSNVTLYAKWTESLTDIAAGITAYLSTQSGGNSANNPVNLPVNLRLTEVAWKAILTAIDTAEKYVALDLSSCTRSNEDSGGGLLSDGTFDPIYDFSTGKNYIVSLILPDVATSIANYTYDNGYSYATFNSFSNLDSVSASALLIIGSFSFGDCTSLTSVSFPQATSIRNYAFGYCTSLTSVSFPLVDYIEAYAFSGCTSLTSVSFPASANFDYNNNPFYNCSSLVSFILTGTGSLSTIEGGKALVRYNTELIAYPSASGSVTLNNITSIGRLAFSGCTSLTSVSFPASTTIAMDAFRRCTNLVSFILTGTGSLSTIEGGKVLVRDNTELIAYPSASGSVVLDNITRIDGGAFSGCTNLTSVSLPALYFIGDAAFSGCINLPSISLPAAKYISFSAFSGCTSLTSVDIPWVEYIGPYAFEGTGTTALTINLGSNAPDLGYEIFYSYDRYIAKTVTVKVPWYADGYGEIPATYSGTDTSENWGNGFRGGGWDNYRDGDGMFAHYDGASVINSNITLHVEYLEEGSEDN